MKVADHIKSFLPAGILILVGLLLYLPTLSFELVYLDDNVWVLDYYWYLKNFSHIREVFFQHDLVTGFFYRPLINFSFMVNAYLSGQNLIGYRLLNLAIHLISSFLVYFIFRRLNYNLRISWAAAFIFALHPVLTQAVVWIPGRTDSLLGLFIFASFIFFLNYLKDNSAQSLTGYGMFLFLAFLTKESAIVFPFLCLFYLIIIFKERRIGRYVNLSITWLIIYLAWIFLRYISLKNSQPMDLLKATELSLGNVTAYVSYLGKILLPVNLSVLPVNKDVSLIPGIMAWMIVLAALLFSKNKDWPKIIFGLLWFVFFLTPALFLSFILHEYRLYVPILGVLMMIAEMDVIKFLAEDRRKFLGTLIPVCFLFFISSYQHSRDFKDRFTFWQKATQTSPHSPLAWRNLGAMYHLENKIDLAKKYYQQALWVNPYEFMVHNNLGLIAITQKDFDRADREFREEIRINPTYDNAYYNYGILKLELRKKDEAAVLLSKTIELNPRFVEAYTQLINIYLANNNQEKAKEYIRKLRMQGYEVPSQWLKLLN